MTALPCPPEHWPRFSHLLDLAMELPEEARGDWVRSLQGADTELGPWLSRVLSGPATTAAHSFLDISPEPGRFLAEPQSGDVVGPYTLTCLLGEGGMGQVWRAARADEGPRRDVALKLPHADLLGASFRRRFKQERDVLATLSHPNIATLYDAGAGTDGTPYLALELVEGACITAHCRQHAAPLPDRVELILQVLAALAYAHARLIVHRDIKPSNVLVTEGGQVKLLDFGIAKLLASSHAGSGEFPLTAPVARLATPGYAAPEQVDGDPITVEVDLFAVGVLLHELCTGQRPRQIVRGADGLPLASACAEAALAALPEERILRRCLRGDLDAIIAKAAAPDPADRYHSADAFADDLRRWRGGLPVSARRIGRAAYVARFVRRHRAATCLAALLVLVVAAGGAGVAWQAARAEHEAQRALAIKDFLIDIFEGGDPHGGGKRTDKLTARELLEAGARRADTAFARDPETEIDLLATLGGIFDALDDREHAEAMWSKRQDLLRATDGPASPRVIASALSLVFSQTLFLDSAQSQAMLETIRLPVLQLYGPRSLQRAQWLTARAASLRATPGGREEALADSSEAVALFEQRYPTDARYPDALLTLSGFQYDAEDYDTSIATSVKWRAALTSRHAYDTMTEFEFLEDMALSEERLGHFAAAEALNMEVQDRAERSFGPQGTSYLHALTVRAHMAHLHGDRTSALALFKTALGGSLEAASLTGKATSLRRLYGAALAREGRAAEAIPILEQALRETRAHLSDEANLRRTEGMLGDAYDQAGRGADARKLLEAARAEWMRYGPAAGWQALGARERWARYLLDHGDAGAAATEFRAVLAGAAGRSMAPAAMAWAGLARGDLAAGRIAQADADSARAVKTIDAVLAEHDVRLGSDIRLIRAQVLRAMGDLPGSQAAVSQVLRSVTESDAPGSRRILAAKGLLAMNERDLVGAMPRQ